MIILGLSCFFHDAAACLVVDGRIVAAAEEERFSRRKHDAGFPRRAIAFCLETAGLTAGEIDRVVFYEKPGRKLDRMLRMLRAHAARIDPAERLPTIARYAEDALGLPETLDREIGYRGPVAWSEHHLSHAASAFYISGFDEAAVLTVDGVGEWTTTELFLGSGNRLRPLRGIEYPHSIGLLYSTLTGYLGFAVNSDEYKVMGLASYGQPRFRDRLHQMVAILPDGSLRCDERFFEYPWTTRRMYSDAVVELFGPARRRGEEITERHRDIAASLQAFTEDAMVAMVRSVEAETDSDALCLAGGVALNCVANSAVQRRTRFKRLCIQPAAGDSGAAMGAALAYAHGEGGASRRPEPHHTSLGPAYDNATIRACLEAADLTFEEFDEAELCRRTAELIAGNAIIGWFQGRMEFGPRALGNRSILANPCNPDMKDILNARVKFREDFRPFAPAVVEERAAEFFELEGDSPFMLLTPKVRPEQAPHLPSITHVDGTARVQTVAAWRNPVFHRLITAFGELTGVPVVINTSFNVNGQPIVCSPDDAVHTFLATDIDYLVIGNFIVNKGFA